jgi:predicted TIM-barrel fold metal-dependent hydrolase
MLRKRCRWRGDSGFPATVLVAILGLAAGGCDSPDVASPRRAAATSASPAPGLVDHHVHLLSPRLVADWKSLGVPFSKPDAAYLSADSLLGTGAAGGTRASSAAPLARAVLVSMAHVYGNPEFRTGLGLDLAAERERVAAENDHVAREAARHPGRAAAFAAAHPLRPYASAELRRAREVLLVAGFKVHLGSARFDPRDATHLASLAGIAELARELGVPMLLHLDPQREAFDDDDVARIFERGLAGATNVDVIVAHLGGSGGFDARTQAILTACADWIESRPAGESPRLWFDLAAVPLTRSSEGMAASSREEIAALAPALRRLGLRRVLFGSDYPVFDPLEQWAALIEGSTLDERELETIRTNVGPIAFRAARSE